MPWAEATRREYRRGKKRYASDLTDEAWAYAAPFMPAMETREPEDREARLTAGVIGSQSVKAMEIGGIRGYDAGKKINGRKRHVVVGTPGLMFGAVVQAADIQDRDGAQGFKVIPHGSSNAPFAWLGDAAGS